jgi:hypothetical protein
VNSRYCAPSTSGSFGGYENLRELNKDAEEEYYLNFEREAVKNGLMNVLRIYCHVV